MTGGRNGDHQRGRIPRIAQRCGTASSREWVGRKPAVFALVRGDRTPRFGVPTRPMGFDVLHHEVDVLEDRLRDIC